MSKTNTTVSDLLSVLYSSGEPQEKVKRFKQLSIDKAQKAGAAACRGSLIPDLDCLIDKYLNRFFACYKAAPLCFAFYGSSIGGGKRFYLYPLKDSISEPPSETFTKDFFTLASLLELPYSYVQLVDCADKTVVDEWDENFEVFTDVVKNVEKGCTASLGGKIEICVDTKDVIDHYRAHSVIWVDSELPDITQWHPKHKVTYCGKLCILLE